MHADHATEWLEKIFVPNAEPESLLLIDKWSGYKQCLSSKIIAENGYKVRILPAGTTGKLQPLDVFVNRQIKSFIRLVIIEISFKILLESYPTKCDGNTLDLNWRKGLTS